MQVVPYAMLEIFAGALLLSSRLNHGTESMGMHVYGRVLIPVASGKVHYPAEAVDVAGEYPPAFRVVTCVAECHARDVLSAVRSDYSVLLRPVRQP